jgi:hypothetical protein
LVELRKVVVEEERIAVVVGLYVCVIDFAPELTSKKGWDVKGGS